MAEEGGPSKKRGKKKGVDAEEGLPLLNVNVGIVGHVDHGKTSLVRALSTTLSTAALDKHPQSQERGITIDLGFSALALPMPARLKDRGFANETLQLTLVDCPGHASFVKTTIGGASIIDMMLLVVDALKGVQAQTIESLVVGEITAEKLVVALNKCDAVGGDDVVERDKRLDLAEAKLRKQLAASKFFARGANKVRVCRVAANVGGGRGGIGASASSSGATTTTTSWGLDELREALAEEAPFPSRDVGGPFFFSIDHCFPIKGQGSVVTGTCLRGRASINQTAELPLLGVEKKIKSIQMFKRPVKSVACGDRAGICLAQLDASTVERGLLASPGSVPLVACAVAKVRKVRYYLGTADTDSKFHVTAGHSTALATATFFGAYELASKQRRKDSSSSYAPTNEYRFQEHLVGALGDDPLKKKASSDGVVSSSEREDEEERQQEELEQYCLLRFDQKVRCQEDALVIGSRLDVDATMNACRIAFYGRLVWTSTAAFSSDTADLPRLYKMKQKTSRVVTVENPNSAKPGVHYEVIAEDLFKKEANMQQFVGLRLQADTGDVGTLAGAYGREGKYKVTFKEGTTVRPTGTLYLRYKRYHFASTTTTTTTKATTNKATTTSRHKMHQDDDCFFDAASLPDFAKESVAASVAFEIEEEKRKKEEAAVAQAAKAARVAKAATKAAAAQRKGSIPTTTTTTTPTTTTTTTKKHQGNGTNGASPLKSPSSRKKTDDDSSDSKVGLPRGGGRVERLKGDPGAEGKYAAVIAEGFFLPEDDQRPFAGRVVRGSNGDVGRFAGPFGKAGKSKVEFSDGGTSLAVGDDLTLLPEP